MYKYVQYKAIQMLLYYKESEMAVLEDDSFLFESLFFPFSYLFLQLCKQSFGNMWYDFQK